MKPLKGRIIGALEGNHEYTIRKCHNEDIHGYICSSLETDNLTDEAIIRFRFTRKGGSSAVVMVYLQHGNGGGRSYGAEPNHLGKLRDNWESCDIVLRGHSHTPHILPPKPVLYVPKSGKVPDELHIKHRYAANWGCWKYSHMSGPSSYESRANYPAHAMETCEILITPFAPTSQKKETQVKIEMRSVVI